MTEDKEFLNWLADRLVHVYGENPNVDFVHKLRAIAKNADLEQIRLRPCVGLRDHQLTEEDAVALDRIIQSAEPLPYTPKPPAKEMSAEEFMHRVSSRLNEVRKLPAVEGGRVETGPVQFGDDWPGVFVRGDNAFGYAMALREAMEKIPEGFNKMQIKSLCSLLGGAVVIPVKSPEKIKVPTIDGETEIEAMKFTEENKDQVYNWARSIQNNVYHDFSEDNKPILRITTIFDGEIICRLGDYLVKTDDEQRLNVVR
jgi:hypothetical protein